MVIWSTELHKTLIDVGVCAPRAQHISVMLISFCVSVTGNVMCSRQSTEPASLVHDSHTLDTKNLNNKYLHELIRCLHKWCPATVSNLFMAWKLRTLHALAMGLGGFGDVRDVRWMHFDSDYDGTSEKFAKLQLQTDWCVGNVHKEITKPVAHRIRIDVCLKMESELICIGFVA